MPAPRIHHRRSKPTPPDKSILGRLVLFVAIAEPLMTLPQIYQIWWVGDAHGVSLVTWVCYAFASVIWLLYGLKTNSKPLALTGALWTLMDLLVAVGILLFS